MSVRNKNTHCSPESIMTLLIGYSPIQNKKLKKKKKEIQAQILSKNLI